MPPIFAMELTTWFVIVPLSLASLLTGVVQSLGTHVGLVQIPLGPGETTVNHPLPRSSCCCIRSPLGLPWQV